MRVGLNLGALLLLASSHLGPSISSFESNSAHQNQIHPLARPAERKRGLQKRAPPDLQLICGPFHSTFLLFLSDEALHFLLLSGTNELQAARLPGRKFVFTCPVLCAAACVRASLSLSCACV